MIDRLIKIGRYFGMEMNVEEFKIMKISRQSTSVQIVINQKGLKRVECFSSLCSMLTNGARCTLEF